MTTIAKVLIQSKQAEAAETTQYTSTNCTTIIDKFTAKNTDAVTRTLEIKLVANAGTASAEESIITASISPGRTYTFPEIVGHVLDTGDFLSTLASTAAVINIRMSGRQITT